MNNYKSDIIINNILNFNIKISSVFIFTFVSLINVSCSQEKEQPKPQNIETNYYAFISQLKVPEKLEFCGERVPLEIPEVKERAEREFYLLLQTPGQIILYIKRSGKYFPIFEKYLKEQNLPDDIKYLSVAESALYMARSPKDAVGLWQFIPSTAKKFGLLIDDYVDERKHPEKSTEVALKYLNQGFKAHQSWTLAAAGYNMGQEGVANSLDFQTKNNFYDLFLNDETSRYILRIILIKELMSNASKYGFKISSNDIYKPDSYKLIDEKDAIPNLAEWAKSHNASYKDIKLLNPWILQKSLPLPHKGKSWCIAVPDK